MFKKLYLPILILFLMGCASANNVSEKSKVAVEKSRAVGFVDIERVFKTSVPGKSAQEKYNNQKDKMEQDLKQKGGEIEELRKQIERDSMIMSKEKREEKERLVRIKLDHFKSLQIRYRKQLQNLEKKQVNALRKEVSTLVKDVGKKEGYILIIKKDIVLYSRESIDLTGKIIKRLNKKYPE